MGTIPAVSHLLWGIIEYDIFNGEYRELIPMSPFNLTTFSIQQLAFERHYQFLFKQLNVELHSGDLVQVCGNNGTGKSTLLRILAGFIEPHAGNIVWQGKSIFTELDAYQQQIHYLAHQNGIKPHLTVLENLTFNFALANKRLDLTHLNPLVDELSLSRLLDTKALHLSAGQLRRLAMLRIIANPAPLWILDEPMTALDASGQALLIDYLRKHLANQGMAIVATHQALPFANMKTIHLGEFHGE